MINVAVIAEEWRDIEGKRNVDIANKYNCSTNLIGVWKHNLKKEGLIQWV